jgi:hypothetical protein
MSTSKARAERRANLRAEYEKNKLEKVTLSSGGGYGLGQSGIKPAQGQRGSVNTFILPKAMGLNVSSLTYPNNYDQTWDLTMWRQACRQVMNMGWPIQYAALTSWVFECSPFVQHLFRELGVSIENVPVYFIDQKGNKVDEWSKEICEKVWFQKLRKEYIYSWFWGFTGINFDPLTGETFKYPMQDIDPINRMLRKSSFEFNEGINFADNINLLYVQPSSNAESFLGWMQPISREFIRMNMNDNNWVAAGKRFAYPIMQVGYPENSNALDTDDVAFNPYKIEAENIIRDADPTNGITYPYTRNSDGSINKSIEIDFSTGSQGNGGAYRVYSDFNEMKKNEILQMITLSTLSSASGKVGSQALGKIHMEKYETVIKSLIEWQLDELNRDFLKKIAKFYKNFPKGLSFGVNKAKQWKLDEIVQMSAVLKENNKQLSTDFFIEQGLSPNFLEDAPTIAPINTKFEPKEEPKIEMATKPGLFDGLKKKVQLD